MREDFENRERGFDNIKRRWEERMDRRGRHNHVWTGMFIILLGVGALVKASVTNLPDWLFSWQMFLIVLGFFIGLKHGFRGGAWFIMMLVGGVFLLNEIYPDLTFRRYMWPLALIVAGAFIILHPRRRNWSQSGWNEKKNAAIKDSSTLNEEKWSQDDFVDSTSIFGSAKKNILSKDFKGGDIVNIFGGTELNLTQADINGKVTLELTTIFGGTLLIVPANWAVLSEAVTIFGGLEDKRTLSAPTASPPDKVLLLKGTVIFGGIEIKSF